jgi:hypothetical protein
MQASPSRSPATARRPGTRMPRLLRARMERLFGARLGDVRLVVSDVPRPLNARAFALGSTVHLAPDVPHAKRAARHQVLGHEIAHVLQQRAGATRRWWGRVADSAMLQQKAARAGRRIAAGRAAHLAARKTGRAAPWVQRIKLVLRDTRDGDLDAPALLNMMDSALSAKLAGAPGCAKVRGTNTVTQGRHGSACWARLRWARRSCRSTRASALPCSVKVSGTGSAMPIYAFGGTTERIDLPAGAVRWARGNDVARIAEHDLKLDLNCIQIADGFQKLNNAGHTDDLVAGDRLLKMKGRAMATDYGANANAFMEAMAGLMFGVEASRFPSSFVTSLLLLDLVRTKKGYGRAGTKKFKLVTAFDSGRSFDFECLYGGKFPCAVHEPGKGNAANRRMLGELGGQTRIDEACADTAVLPALSYAPSKSTGMHATQGCSTLRRHRG